MSLPYKSKLIPLAKKLRKTATPQEKHLWYDFLRSYPVRFQRQKTISGYIADFYCHAAKLVIEIDGSQHYTEQGIEYDNERSRVLARYGLTVLRFTNNDIDARFREVCGQIRQTVEERIQGDHHDQL